jgi:hypothetical protein
MGGTLLAAAGLALFAVIQRSFFERHIQERYDVRPARFASLAPQLQGRLKGVQAFKALPPEDRVGVYEAWMQAADEWPAGAPAAMAWADPDLCFQRVQRTLLCGSQTQRCMAIRFLRLSSHPQAVPLIERARADALARHELPLAQAAQEALDSFTHGLKLKAAPNQ